MFLTGRLLLLTKIYSSAAGRSQLSALSSATRGIKLCSLEIQTKAIRGFVITEKAATRVTTAFTFKTLLRHYAKWALTPQSLNVGPQPNYHMERADIRHYANQTARPL